MICIAELMDRCEKLQPFSAIDDDLACEFVAMIDQGQSIGCIYEMLGLSPLKAKKLIRQSEIMMRCGVIYALCATGTMKARKKKRRKFKLSHSHHEIYDTFRDARKFLLDSNCRWLRRSGVEAMFGSKNSPKGVCYIKDGWLVSVETIKPTIFAAIFYKVS